MVIMAISTGTRIVRELISMNVLTRYRLMKEMNVSSIEVINAWMRGQYFNEGKHLPRLLEVREKWLRAKNIGIYS